MLCFTIRLRSYFYPRSPCGERRWLRCWQLAARDISIHALLAESDNVACGDWHELRDFYPRSPCGERRAGCGDVACRHKISIHALLAESDQKRCLIRFSTLHFYPRSPCGERPCGNAAIGTPITISIHALLAESDRMCSRPVTRRAQFLSTLSLRRATHRHGFQKQVFSISIHALLAESDHSTLIQAISRHNFYPRSPCGERPVLIDLQSANGDFYPRSPCGERPSSTS